GPKCRAPLQPRQAWFGARLSITADSKVGGAGLMRRARRGHRERAAIDCLVGSDLPPRRIVASHSRCVRDNDRANTAQFCLQRWLPLSAGRHRIHAEDCAPRNELLPQRPPVEKSAAPAPPCAASGFSPTQIVACSARVTAPSSDAYGFCRGE